VEVVAVDDVDLGLTGIEPAAQAVGRHGAAGTPAQDHNLFRGHPDSLAPPPRRGIRAGAELFAVKYRPAMGGVSPLV
jgi:hypothetical protein